MSLGGFAGLQIRHTAVRVSSRMPINVNAQSAPAVAYRYLGPFFPRIRVLCSLRTRLDLSPATQSAISAAAATAQMRRTIKRIRDQSTQMF